MPEKNYDSYKQIRDLVLMMNKELDDLKQTYTNSLFTTTGIPFTKGVFDIVLPYTVEEIKNEMDIEKLRSVVGPYEIMEAGQPSRFNALSDDAVREVAANVKTLSLVLLQMEKECDDIRKEASDVMNEYVNYLSSKQIIKDKEEKLKMFKDANLLEMDDDARRANERNINILENQISFKFLTERIDKYGYKEKENLMAKFFDNNRGKMVVDKFKAKAKRLGYNPEIFTYFLNIEENFLPEEYHPFNNFFLSIYMSFGGCCSEYINSDKIYFASITSSIASLIYHSFQNQEDEVKFIDFIKSVLDRFKDDPEHDLEIVDKFKMLNRSYSQHPDRIRADKAREEIKRNTIFKRLEELDVENPFSDDCDVEEAMKFLNEKVEEIKKAQLEAADDTEVEVTDAAIKAEENIQGNIDAVRERLEELDEDEDTEVVEDEEAEEVEDDSDDDNEDVSEVSEADEETTEDSVEEEEVSSEDSVDGDTDVIDPEEVDKAIEALYE